ncbi:MAG: acyl-CoA dehydrogenase [Chitinophagia bacterium]|nr:acyl-CoA dehydrogenase [Chitinophagia bacterium]
MDFKTSESTSMIGSSVKEFAARRIKPFSMEWDESQEFPRDLFKEMGQLGLMGVLVPEAYGGTGLGYEEYVEAIVELSKADPSIGLSMAAHNSLCTGHIMAFGNEEQKRRWLPRLASGEWIGAWGLTEPNTGSDAMRMLTTAVDKGDHWLLNGAKCWITHGNSSEIAVVMVRTGELLDSHGISALVVERGTEGWLQGRKENKLGIRGSDTHSIMFQDVKVPKENRIGEDGFGFKFAMMVLAGGRIGIASQALGIASGAYELALKYSKERKAFGTEISNHQAIAFKLADMATEIEAARLLCFKAAWEKDQHLDYTLSASMAKLFASDIAQRVTNEAVQVHGGYGYVKEFHVERLMRDAKITQIYEGTSEVQRIVISRTVLKG